MGLGAGKGSGRKQRLLRVTQVENKPRVAPGHPVTHTACRGVTNCRKQSSLRKDRPFITRVHISLLKNINFPILVSG